MEEKKSLQTQLFAVGVILIAGVLLIIMGHTLAPKWSFMIFFTASILMMGAFALVGMVGRLVAIIHLVLLAGLICCPPEMRPIYQGQLADYKVHLGLDLKGGSELLYKINTEEIESGRSVERVIDETISVISQRIFESQIEVSKGDKNRRVVVRDPRIQRQGDTEILIQLPGLDPVETEMVKQKIQTLGNLEFRLVASKKTGADDDEEGKTIIDEDSEYSKYEKYKNTANYASYQKSLKRKGYAWFPTRDAKKETSKDARLLWIEDKRDFTGKKFQSFFLTSNSTGSSVIGFELKQEYKADFGEFTGKYKKEFLAIVFNGKVVAAPQINDKIPGNGIMVGFDAKELASLLDILKSGSLEIQPELVQEQNIGPSLGEDTIRLGIIAGVIGLVLVVGFMLFYYLGAGLIADTALVVNIVLLYAILVVGGETLTLPGIAGIILTMGMAVDANIIIFERIREEKQKLVEIHKNEKNPNPEGFIKNELMEVLEKGHDRAFSTILDSNITTLIIAVVLYMIGSGTVKGFAFTLGAGIIVSFFTAIVFAKILLTLSIQSGFMNKMLMLDWIGKPGIVFTSKMKWGALISTIVILAGMILFTSKGEKNYGLDLKGGIVANMSLEKSLTSDIVRDRLKDKFASIEVQNIQTPEGSTEKGWYEFSLRMPNLNQEEMDEIKNKLNGLSKAIADKNQALKDISSDIARYSENSREAKKTYNKLKRENASEKELKEAEEEKNRWTASIKDRKEQEGSCESQIAKLREEQSALVAEKNRKSGIEELRKRLETTFKDELRPFPFSKIKPGQGRFSHYHTLAINLQTPVSASFVKEILQKTSNLKSAEVASQSYQIWIKSEQEIKEPEKELTEQLKRKLDVVSRLEASQIKVEKAEKETAFGNYRILLTFDAMTPEFAVRNAVEKCEWKGFSLVPIENGNQDMKHFGIFFMLSSEMQNRPAEELQKALEEDIITSFTDTEYNGRKVYMSNPFPKFYQISGLVAQAQKAKAYQGIFLSLLAMLLYIALRFPSGLIFGLGAMLPLAHDVMITLGAIAFFSTAGLVNVEIDLTVIAALLTIIGYSINDTIVIFDRLREERQKYDKEIWERMSIQKVKDEYNRAINQTLGRTLFTSFTTLLPLVAIFVLNYGKGSVLEGFSFALLVGITVGTYSSILLATGFTLFAETKKRVA